MLQGPCFEVRVLRKPKAMFPQQNEDRVFNNSMSRLEVRVLLQNEGYVAASKLKSSGMRPFEQSRVASLNNPEHVLLIIQSRVSQQFRAVFSK